MPNHVTTILVVEDDAGMPIEDIRKVFVNEKGHVDFNVIVEMPECLQNFEPHSGVTTRAEAALGLLQDPRSLDGEDLNSLTGRLHFSNAMRDITTKARDEDIPLIARAIENYGKCGYTYWYDWANDNWGTKWNCYGQPDDGHPLDARSFEFETAWSHPEDLIRKISMRLPGVGFLIRFADEDMGSNCGQYRMKSGETYDEDIAPRYPDQTESDKRKYTEMAFRIRYGNDEVPAKHGYNSDWEYNDDLYEANN